MHTYNNNGEFIHYNVLISKTSRSIREKIHSTAKLLMRMKLMTFRYILNTIFARDYISVVFKMK